MPAPTIERVKTGDGVQWRITYAGMTRIHRQDWQAWWYYEWAKALYATDSALGKNRPA